MKCSFSVASLMAAMLLVCTLNALSQPVTFTGEELLGRPTNNSITINVVSSSALDSYFEYGTSPGVYTNQTAVVTSAANEPIEAVISGLNPNTQYFYRLQYRRTGTSVYTARTEHSFRTQRPAGSNFVFDITSDSHVNVAGLGNATTWRNTLTNVASDNPDFLIDCGDTFSMDNITTETGARNSYIFQRTATTMGLVSPSVPIFLAVGNHEEQEGWHLGDNANPALTKPVFGTNAQKRYFLNPVPDAFYSGNNDTYANLDGDHLHEDYYAWTWGNALFVVIDPYWYTTAKPFIGNTGGGEPGASDGDRWHWTLGQAQYDWLKNTLHNSSAGYKFLFMHHMTGGTDDYIRGGAYAVPFCEWGGFDEDGVTNTFAAHRPGWSATIHQVLIDNHVTAVFHGHDHQYAYEVKDGIVYQSLPAAGFTGNGFNLYSEVNPLTLRVLPSGGHLRVSITPTIATVDYINTATGAVNFSYNMAATIQQGSLPVTMKNFTLQTENNKKVVLKWATTGETNNKQFILQRSRPSEEFKDIARIVVKHSPNGSDYSYIDEPGINGACLYRLIQEDIDGKLTHIGTKVANLKNGSNWLVTDNGRSWMVRTNQQVSYNLVDLQGRVIEKGSFNGYRQINKPSGGFMYVLQVICDGVSESKKLFLP